MKILIMCIGLICTSAGKNSKRLLLNDPDVLNNRLNQLEGMVMRMNATMKQQQSTIEHLQQENQQFKQQLESSLNIIQKYGAMYIRWARKQCPNNNTELVYSGYAGGGIYSDAGSAAEYVCLPPDPDYVKTSGSDYGRIYGGEFNSNFFAPNSAKEDVPCALCRVKYATSVIMIPGKNKCYNGWKLEYHGYLAAGYHSHTAATSYVCVDIQPEYIVGGVDQNYGKFFYEVVSKCGSLKCPPYINNYPLTCVVCSK